MTSSKERRLLAVMFTDVVGYTALRQGDEEAARIVRRRHRQVLEGSVRKSGDRVRITAQLVDTRDGYHIFSKVYDRVLEAVRASHSLQQHQRQPQREQRAHDDHAHEAHRAEGLALNVGDSE